MEDEYLERMEIGSKRVLNSSEFIAHGEFETTLQLLERDETNGLIKIDKVQRESYRGYRELKQVIFTRLQ